jgi:hypothetical protein
MGWLWGGGGLFHFGGLLIGSDTARSQPKESIVLVSDGLHEVISIRAFVILGHPLPQCGCLR